jgi:hypothetical protein
MISTRTKAALAAAKARGVKLGGRRKGNGKVRRYQALGGHCEGEAAAVYKGAEADD